MNNTTNGAKYAGDEYLDGLKGVSFKRIGSMRGRLNHGRLVPALIAEELGGGRRGFAKRSPRRVFVEALRQHPLHTASQINLMKTETHRIAFAGRDAANLTKASTSEAL